MILFSDDVQMSDDMKMIFKNSIRDFQEQFEQETDNTLRKDVVLKVPPRLTWWLTAVADMGDDETERRCLQIGIEVNEHKIEYHFRSIAKEKANG